MKTIDPIGALARQLHAWAKARGVILWPQVWQMRAINGDATTASTEMQPTGGAIVCGFELPSWQGADVTGASTRQVAVTSFTSGGRKLLEGSLLVQDLNSMQASEREFIAPVLVYPGDTLKVQVQRIDGGGALGGVISTPLSPQAWGFQILSSKGVQLEDEAARKMLADLSADVGEWRCIGMQKFASGVDVITDSTTPESPMTIERIECGTLVETWNLTEDGIESLKLEVGQLRVFPDSIETTATNTMNGVAPRLPLGGVTVSPGTRLVWKLGTHGVMNTSKAVAFFGRALR